MYQINNILFQFNPQIFQNDNIYEIRYVNGEYKGNVIYEKRVIRGVKKPIIQNVYVIKSSDMGDVIEYINKKSPLTDEDLLSINKIIRDDSLSILMGYIKSN